jgi:hypothetical protein
MFEKVGLEISYSTIKPRCMKRYALVLVAFMSLQACNDSNDSSSGEKDPSVMQPPSDAIPDSMKLMNDSVIVPDTTPGNGRQAGQSDSIQKTR